MLIRPLTLADCDAVDAAFGVISGDIDPRAELAQPSTHSWAAFDDSGGLLGFALAWLVVDELQLIWIGTRREARRQGVARALLERLVSDGRALGARRVLLEVSGDNAPAIALYEHAGFTLLRVRRGYYRKTGQDALELALAL